MARRRATVVIHAPGLAHSHILPEHIEAQVALKDLATGDTVVKYGEDIGKMVGDAGQGGHVHTHNCKTKRW